MNSATQGKISEANQKLDEMARALNEADSSKKKLTVEGQDLARQIEDAEAYIAELGKTKISLTTQVRETEYSPLMQSSCRADVCPWRGKCQTDEQYFCTNLVLSQIFFLASYQTSLTGSLSMLSTKMQKGETGLILCM